MGTITCRGESGRLLKRPSPQATMKKVIALAALIVVLRMLLPRIYHATEAFLLSALGKATNLTDSVSKPMIRPMIR